MKRRTQRIKLRIVLGYLFVMALLISGASVALYHSWNRNETRMTGELIRESSTASSLIQSSLLDASKLLGAARDSLEKEFLSRIPDDQRIHQILRSTIGTYCIYNSPDDFGLLLYVDRDGFLLARNNEYPAEHYDFSDRFYYLDLRDNPSKKFTVGNLRRAQTTGEMVFHFSMRLNDSKGRFAGIVAQQIDERQMAEKLGEMLGESASRIVVYNANYNPSFIYPYSSSHRQSLLADSEDRLLLHKIEMQEKNRGCIVIPPAKGGSEEASYVGYQRDPLFGLVTTARIPQSEVTSAFLTLNLQLLVFSLLSFVAISALFLGLYRQAGHLESALLDATLDHTTMISNRRAMEHELQRLWLDASRRNRPISMLFLDIDRFKSFNDLHGHDAGDMVLRNVARTILQSLQRPLDFCGRWGGEEFVVILPDTPQDSAKLIAERICRNVKCLRIMLKGVELPAITLSVGIATSNGTGTRSPEELVRMADLAMLEAKESGRDRIVLYRRHPGEETTFTG